MITARFDAAQSGTMFSLGMSLWSDDVPVSTTSLNGITNVEFMYIVNAVGASCARARPKLSTTMHHMKNQSRLLRMTRFRLQLEAHQVKARAFEDQAVYLRRTVL